MRLADFILQFMEPILKEWESFARTIPSGAKLDRVTLRDHAQDILRAAARDMTSSQSRTEQSDKSKGVSDANTASDRLTSASKLHALGRLDCGFVTMELVSEYRALRASVIRLWREHTSRCAPEDLDDLTRFNEAIDQSLTDAVDTFTRRVDQSRQMFLAILGHDLRTPLNSISMAAQLLKHENRLDPDSAQTVAQMSASTLAIERMITDLMDYSTSQLGGRMPITPAPMNLEALCREVFAECHLSCPDARIRFQSEGDTNGTWDSPRLRQVLSNLLGNAIQHGLHDGIIGFSLKAFPNEVVITFHNHGTPIPKELLPAIFDPLVRGAAQPAKHRRPGSIGLGLYIAREIVSAHGGTIEVESSADTGTLFTLRLPRNPEPAFAIRQP